MDMVTYKKAIAARDDMLKELNDGKKHWSHCACIAIVFNDSHHISPNQACHAGLKNDYAGNKRSGALAVVNGLMQPNAKETLDEEDAVLFLDWLLNRSPYASTFITKSAHEALLHKATISDANTPSNLMAAGMVASRRLWEYAYIARVFCDLVKAGVDEDLAFYLGHLYQGKFDRTGKVSFGTSQDAHCSISPCVMGGEELKNFLNHTPVNLNPTYNDSWNYSGYDGMYGTVRGATMKDWIHNNFPYKAGKVVVKDVNPFPKDHVGAFDDKRSCSYDELIKGMVDFQHKIFEHIKLKQPTKKAA